MPSLLGAGFAALSTGRLRARTAAAGKMAVERDAARQAQQQQQQQQPEQPPQLPQLQPSSQQQQPPQIDEWVNEKQSPGAGAPLERVVNRAPVAQTTPPAEHGPRHKGLLSGLSLRGLRKESQAEREPAARESLPAPASQHKARFLGILSGSSFRAKTKRSASAAASAGPAAGAAAPAPVASAASEPGIGGGTSAGASAGAAGAASGTTAANPSASTASAVSAATAAAAAATSSAPAPEVTENSDAPKRIASSASLRGTRLFGAPVGKGTSAARAGASEEEGAQAAAAPQGKRKGARAAVKAFTKLLGLGGVRSKRSNTEASAAAGSQAVEEEEEEEEKEGNDDPREAESELLADQLVGAERDKDRKVTFETGAGASEDAGAQAAAAPKGKRKGARAAVKAFTKLLGLGGGRSKRSDTEASAVAGSQAIEEEEEEEGDGPREAEPEPPTEELASAELDKDGKIPLAFASRLLSLLPEGGRAGLARSDSDLGELSQQSRVANLAACLFEKSRGRVVNPYAAEAAWKEAWADPSLRVSFHVALAAAVAHVIDRAARADGALLLPYGDASVNSAEDLLEKLPPAMVRLLERTRRALPTLEGAGFVEWATPRLLGPEAAPGDLRTLLAATQLGSDSDSSNEDEDDDEEGEGGDEQVEEDEELEQEQKDGEGSPAPGSAGVTRGSGPFEAIALAEFIPNKKTDIQLQVGERLRVLKVYGDGWCLGEQLSTGRQGEFPTSHIRREDAASTACALSALESVLSASGAQPGSAQALSLLREIAFSLDSALEAQVPLRQLVVT
jgi:hypothetical protein